MYCNHEYLGPSRHNPSDQLIRLSTFLFEAATRLHMYLSSQTTASSSKIADKAKKCSYLLRFCQRKCNTKKNTNATEQELRPRWRPNNWRIEVYSGATKNLVAPVIYKNDAT